MKKLATTLILVLACGVFWTLTPVGEVVSKELQEVMVLNFPTPQQITGEVTIEGTIRSAELATIENVTVPPVNPKDTNRLIDAGTLDADGYPYAVLSLAGFVKGSVGKSGTIGVLLIPEVASANRAFNEKGQLLFPIEVQAPAEPGSTGFFGSEPLRATLAFPRYKVFLFNTTDQSVSADLYAYLTND